MENFCKLKALYQLIHQIESEIQQKHGLSATECLTICSIDKGLNTHGDLALSLGLTKPRMSKILIGLQHKGYITSTPYTTDKRKTIVTLTNTGKQKAQLAETSDIEIPEIQKKCP